jgi:hypothetical protein
VERAGPREQREDVVRHGLPAGGGRGIEDREIARVAVHAEGVLDLVHEVERVAGQARGVGHLADVEHDLEPAGHRVPADHQRVDVGFTAHGGHRGASPRSKAS